MAKEKFDRSKPHVNVGTIGHVDMVKQHNCRPSPMASNKKGLSRLEHSTVLIMHLKKEKSITIATAHVEYSTEKDTTLT